MARENDYTKRYYLFDFGDYYPCGGLGDVWGTFDNPTEAWEAFRQEEKSGGDACYLFDKMTGKTQDWNYGKIGGWE